MNKAERKEQIRIAMKKYYNKTRETRLDYQNSYNYYKFVERYKLRGRYIEEDKIICKNDLLYIKQLWKKGKEIGVLNIKSA